jgi:hypothetical protein
MRLESCQPAINVVSAPPSYYSVRLAVGETSVRASSSDARRQRGVAARRSNISTLPTRILLSVATQSGCGFAKIAIGALHFCGSSVCLRGGDLADHSGVIDPKSHPMGVPSLWSQPFQATVRAWSAIDLWACGRGYGAAAGPCSICPLLTGPSNKLPPLSATMTSDRGHVANDQALHYTNG